MDEVKTTLRLKLAEIAKPLGTGTPTTKMLGTAMRALLTLIDEMETTRIQDFRTSIQPAVIPPVNEVIK